MERHVKRLASAAAVCVLITVILCLVSKPETSDTTEQSETLYVDNINLNSVAGIVLKNKSGAVPLMLYNGEIEFIDAPVDTDIDDSVIKAFAYRMAHIPAKKCIGPVEKLSDFGLEKPVSTVSLMLSNGDTVRISLGDEAPFDGGYYIKAENDPKVYLTDDVTARMMRYSRDDFRKLDVLPDIPSNVTLSDLTGFGLIRGDEVIEITGTPGKDGMSYVLKRPFEAALDWENVANYIYAPISCLDECAFVSAGGDFDKYGFDDDDVYSVIFAISGKTYKMYFTDAGDGYFYVCRDGSDQIVKVKADFLSFLNVRVSDLVSDTLYSVNAAELDRVRVEADGIDCTVNISGSGENLRAQTDDGTVLDSAETVTFVKSVTMLPRAGMLTDEANIAEKPILRLTFTRRSGEENIIELIPVTQWHCAVVVDGEYSEATYTSTVNEIVSEVYSALGR